MYSYYRFLLPTILPYVIGCHLTKINIHCILLYYVKTCDSQNTNTNQMFYLEINDMHTAHSGDGRKPRSIFAIVVTVYGGIIDPTVKLFLTIARHSNKNSAYVI